MSDIEVDFAMKYSEERKRSIKLETRLYAAMYQTIPYAGMTAALVEHILKQDTEGMAVCVRDLIAAQAEIEAVMTINLIDNVGFSELVPQRTMLQAGSLSNLPGDIIKTIHDSLYIASKKVLDQWDDLAAEHSMHTIASMTEKNSEELKEIAFKHLEESGTKH